MTPEVEQFLTEVTPRQEAAEHALTNGDLDPWARLWSHRDPVTLFGAGLRVRSGWDELVRTFRWLAERFREGHGTRLEVVAAGVSGDLAYTVGFEHKTARTEGELTTYSLRVTHVYRREDGEWRIVHRHGDFPPEDRAP